VAQSACLRGVSVASHFADAVQRRCSRSTAMLRKQVDLSAQRLHHCRCLAQPAKAIERRQRRAVSQHTQHHLVLLLIVVQVGILRTKKPRILINMLLRHHEYDKKIRCNVGHVCTSKRSQAQTVHRDRKRSPLHSYLSSVFGATYRGSSSFSSGTCDMTVATTVIYKRPNRCETQNVR